MYAKTLSIYGFRCFGKAVLDLQYPGRIGPGSQNLESPNINLIVGDNGGGKSSVLRAIAIAALAPALLESGFVPYRLVRRPDAPNALLKLVCELDGSEEEGASPGAKTIELLARIDRRDRGSLDRLHLERTPDSPIEQLIYDDYSHTFFVVGYGATRRAESGDFSESSSRKSRGLRYQRVASLFEDSVALRPLQSWLPRVRDTDRKNEAIRAISSVLPKGVVFTGDFDESENQYVIDFHGVKTPFSALSDGYRAFISWVGDLVGHLSEVAPVGVPIRNLSGIVLVDEIDLHLHPAWQRVVVQTLAQAFPRLQFVLTTHSPLIASSLRKENIFVTDTDEMGLATVKQISESVYGRTADQLLMSSYFGLETTVPPTLEKKSKSLFARAVEGDSEAALAYLEQLSAPPAYSAEVVPVVREVLDKPVSSRSKSLKARSSKTKKKSATKITSRVKRKKSKKKKM